MIREIGSVYSKIEYVTDRMYVVLDGVEYAIENEWVKLLYQVTKEGDKIIAVSLPTDQEIREHLKIQGLVDLDNQLKEEWGKLKSNMKDFKDKLKAKFNK